MRKTGKPMAWVWPFFGSNITFCNISMAFYPFCWFHTNANKSADTIWHPALCHQVATLWNTFEPCRTMPTSGCRRVSVFKSKM
jgi:hypothetical protein